MAELRAEGMHHGQWAKGIAILWMHKAQNGFLCTTFEHGEWFGDEKSTPLLSPP